MKKFLAILMTLALMLSCMIGFAVSSSAEEAATPVYVEETYSMGPAMEADWGTHEVDEKGNLTASEALFGDGLWTFEWYDQANNEFNPFTAYFAESQSNLGGKCGWSNIYYANETAMFETMPETYVVVGTSGKQFHPGNGAGCVYTFNVPYTGVISYDAVVKAYGEANSSDSENGGDCVYLYVNGDKVWPASDEEAVFYYDTGDKAVSHASFAVNKGDKVRLVVTVKPDTTNGSKGCNMVEFPVITYHEAKDEAGNALPVGNPNGEPPANVIPSKTTGEGFTLSWDPAKKAVGYNVYINGEKHNSEVITATSYTVTGLQPKTNYTVQVTTVTENSESKMTEESLVRTKNDPTAATNPSTDKTTDKTEAPATSDATNNQSDKGGNNSSMLWIIVAAVAAVVLIVVVVVVIIVIKKKKA